MKLFSRYNRLLLIISFSGLLIIGFLFYRTLSYYLNRQIDDDLLEELMEVKEFMHDKNTLPAPNFFEDLIVTYHKVEKASGIKTFSDTIYYNPQKRHQESARYLKTDLTLNGQPYRVLVIASKAEREEQIQSICLIIIIPVTFLLIAILLVNRIMITRLWLPFRQLVKNIKTFNVNDEVPFEPVVTEVQEFSELNEAVVTMSLKVKSDYREIKLFTENASHEMMTPLAVINSKLDTMLQSNILGPEESETLADLYKATSRITKLNQSLLLLVKIDNNLLQEQEEINIKELIEDKLLFFYELISKRNIIINTNLSSSSVFTSRHLVEILVNNLFSNAIRHNYDGGLINVVLSSNDLSFSNTSHNLELDQQKIFERFYKDTTSEGAGLGLSILKQICNRRHFSLKYNYKDDLHIFQISFNSEHNN
ncbi:MAG: Twp-component sensor histidine kinase [Sphingobacteriales bacterium]|nr:Twp-component sensor histidine kinase [Sphingobacteriales bacterium]